MECLWEYSLCFNLLEEFEDWYKLFLFCWVKFTCEAIWSWTFLCRDLFFFFNYRFYFISSDQSVLIFYAFLVQFWCAVEWRRKWQPTPVFLPGESRAQRSLVGCHLWGRTESDMTEATQQQQQQQHVSRNLSISHRLSSLLVNTVHGLFVYLQNQLLLILYHLLFYLGSLLLFLVRLTRGLSILFTLSENQLLVLLIFFYFLNIYFLSDIYYVHPFADFRFCSSFSNSFRWQVRLFV